MIVKVQKPIEFVNETECRVDLFELEKAIIWYSNKPVSRLKKIFMHGRYPAVSIYKIKIHVHRLLMMFWMDRKLEREEYVHHKDECKLNALRNNLEVLPQSIHQSHHTKGRVFTQIHKERISAGNARRTKKNPELLGEETK